GSHVRYVRADSGFVEWKRPRSLVLCTGQRTGRKRTRPLSEVSREARSRSGRVVVSDRSGLGDGGKAQAPRACRFAVPGGFPHPRLTLRSRPSEGIPNVKNGRGDRLLVPKGIFSGHWEAPSPDLNELGRRQFS